MHIPKTNVNRFYTKLSSLSYIILDFFLPSSCTSCNSPVGGFGIPHFCTTCWNDFSLLQGPVCPRCGRPFESPETLTHSPGHLCLSCRNELPHFDQSVSVGQFEGALREAIHTFKYKPCRSLGKPLSRWMAKNIGFEPGIDIVMPVPLHKRRLRQRGFNQALLLAHGISKRYGLTLSFDNLARTRHTKPQVELSGKDRIANVAGAFSLRRPELIADRSVVLIDDVFTTGATLNECSRALKDAGASRVMALTLARAG